MAYFKRHTHAEAEESKLKPIRFPNKESLQIEIESGVTARFIKDRSEIHKSEFKSYKNEISDAIKDIKKSPIPLEIDHGNWKIMSKITEDAKKSCPVTNLQYVCSYRIGNEIRIVYEVYKIESRIFIVFTNCNIHIYRNRLYSDIMDVKCESYRDQVINISVHK